jgi:O-antigen/teichoic acid export membrane protein
MEIVQKLRSSKFLRYNAIFFFGSVIVGVLNYIYYPILGRLMTPASFGEVQALVSLFIQFTIFLNVLSMITVTIITNYKDSDQAHRVIFELEKLALYLALGILLLSIIGGEFLRTSLHFESSLPFVALALAVVVSIPLTFRSAYARGKKKFGVASASQLIGSAVKIVFSIGLVVMGLGTAGAIFGIVGAQTAALFYAAFAAMKLGFERPLGASYRRLPNMKTIVPELKYAVSVFAGLLAVTLLTSVDIIVVKYYFDAHTAGLYAGITTVARIIFFLASPIGQVLMPSVKLEQTAEQNRALFLKSLLLTIGICGIVLLACVVVPSQLVGIMMGEKYVKYATLLPPLATAIFAASLSSLGMLYALALRQTSVAIVGIMGFVITLGALLFWHGSLQAVVYDMLFGSLFTLCITGIYVLVTLKRGVR